MKLRNLALFSIIIIGVVSTSAQNRDYEIEISLENSIVSQTSKKIPVKVTIKNNAELALKTTGLNNIHFYFSKCIVGSVCYREGDIYTSFAKIPSKEIREAASFEFEINLADLYWKDVKSTGTNTEIIKNFNKIPRANVFLYAGIRTLKGYKVKNSGQANSGRKPASKVASRIPVYKTVYSNVVIVTLK